MEVMDIAANEDVVFVHWQATGRHEEQHQVNRHVRDIQPTGEAGTASGISLYRIEGGKFVEGWNYHSVLEFARGMGDGSSGSS